jgi:hypothetical protein
MLTSSRHGSGELHASVGDRLVVRSNRLDGPDRDAEILEVRHADGMPPYLVRWSDTGHVALVFPGPDAFVQQYHPGRGIEPD